MTTPILLSSGKTSKTSTICSKRYPNTHSALQVPPNRPLLQQGPELCAHERNPPPLGRSGARVPETPALRPVQSPRNAEDAGPAAEACDHHHRKGRSGTAMRPFPAVLSAQRPNFLNLQEPRFRGVHCPQPVAHRSSKNGN